MPTNQVASRYVKSVDVSAQQGALITVSTQESPDLAGTSLSIPPGALSKDTTVTLDLGLQAACQSPDVAAGPVAIWGPAGTTFSGDAEMVLPYALPAGQSTQDLYVELVEANGTHLAISQPAVVVDSSTSTVRFHVGGFSTFQVAVRGCPSPNHTCPAGTTCIGGQCRAGCGGAACPAGDICCNDRCVAPTPGTSSGCPGCLSNADCPPNTVCVNGSCTCSNSAGTTCGSQDGGVSCGGNACPPGSICCGYACSTNSCPPPPPQDAGSAFCGGVTCPPNSVCCKNTCVTPVPGTNSGCPGCLSDADCGPNLICCNGACVATANATGGCPPAPDAGTCKLGPDPLSCTSNAICAVYGAVCNPSLGYCVCGSGGSCGSTVCPAGAVCCGTYCSLNGCPPPPVDGGSCTGTGCPTKDGGVTQCGTNGCPAGQICCGTYCSANGCPPPPQDAGPFVCTNSQQCPTQDVCVGGTCRQACSATGALACPVGQTCIYFDGGTAGYCG